MASHSHEITASRQERYDVIRGSVGNILEAFATLLALELQRSESHKLLQELDNKLELTRRKWEKQSFQVAVLALVKSGKSTLINALLGDEYLPATNTPETARIVRISHRNELPGVLREKGRRRASEPESIRSYLRSLNQKAREANESPDEDEVVLEAPLQALVGRSLGEHRFELLDTPGPNEAGTPMMASKVERVLDEADIIVYVLDYTKLKTNEEQHLLELLRELRPELLERCSERLFFVVNKIDLQNRNGLSPKETTAYVAALLQSQLNLKIAAERILPVSAERALLARLVDREQPPTKALTDFIEIAFGALREDEPSLEQCRQQAPFLLKRTGLPRLEEEIITFIYEHRLRLMLQSFVEDLERFLSLFDNHLLTAQETLRKGHAELLGRVTELKGELARIMANLQQISSTTDHVKADTEAWVRKRFEKFKKDARTLIEAVFKPEQGTFRLPRKLHALVNRAWSLLSGVDSDAESARAKVAEVNSRIEAHLRREFSDFNAILEREAHERQDELFKTLNELINPLARQVEDKVGRALDIKLQPARIQMNMPAFEDFSGDISGRIDSFIQRSQQVRYHTEQERHLVRKGGWCSKDQYETRNIVRSTVHTTHSISAEALLTEWTETINEMTEVSVTTARAVIGKVIIQAIEQAQGELDTYSKGLLKTIEQEIKASEAGTSEREGRLKEVGARRDEALLLLRTVRDHRTMLEAGAIEQPVFLSYNTRDQQEVVALAERMKAAGIPVWLDIWDIPPGGRVQRELDMQLKRSRVALVCMGNHGLGRYQELEQEELVAKLVECRCQIIPVILASSNRSPDMPLGLSSLRRIDFRQPTPDPFEQLLWGISEANRAPPRRGS